MSEAKRVFGEGRVCANSKCNLRLGIKEEGVEIDGKVYHQKCNPLKQKPTVRIKSLTDSTNVGKYVQ